MTDHPANWYPDPGRRNELRYWDGARWTEHVSNGGVAGVDPLGPTSPLGGVDPAAIVQQVTGSGYRGAGIESPSSAGTGSIFAEPILVVNQKAKLVEITNQYRVFDASGTQIAAVNEIGQSKARKVLRFVSNVDQFLTHRFEVVSVQGTVLLRLTRPAKFMKSTVVVSDPADVEIGRIVQANVFGKINFDLVAGDETLGAIKAENWRAWNFRIEDATGTEVARITKTWEGLAKAMFTTADNYVVQIHQRVSDPLNSLIVASALCIDTALKQDDN
jgi:uncharacterized protein YxjI